MRNLVIIFILSAICIYGQVNTEKYRTPEDFRGLAGYIEVSGQIQTGNTDKAEGELDGRLDWKLDKVTTFFIFETEHEWVEGTRFSNKGLIHIRNVVDITPRLQTEVFGQINYDKNLLVEDRELAGAGLRYRLIDGSVGDLSIASAYMFEREKYDLPANSIHPELVNVNRWSNYLSLYLKVNSLVTFGGVVYYQPMFDNFGDTRLLNESSLNVQLTKLLSASINFKVRYDSKPPDGIKDTDTKTSFGIALRF